MWIWCIVDVGRAHPLSCVTWWCWLNSDLLDWRVVVIIVFHHHTSAPTSTLVKFSFTQMSMRYNSIRQIFFWGRGSTITTFILVYWSTGLDWLSAIELLLVFLIDCSRSSLVSTYLGLDSGLSAFSTRDVGAAHQNHAHCGYCMSLVAMHIDGIH